MRRITSSALVAVLLAALAGCSSGGDDAGFGDLRPTVGAGTETDDTKSDGTKTATPEPTEAGPIDRSDAELGITFLDLPEATGDEVAAVDAATLFLLAYWLAWTEEEVEEDLDLALGSSVSDYLAFQITEEAQAFLTTGGTVSGTALYEVTDVRIEQDPPEGANAVDQMAFVTGCRDISQVLYGQPGEEPKPAVEYGTPVENLRYSFEIWMWPSETTPGEWYATDFFQEMGAC